MPNPNYANDNGTWTNTTNCYVKSNGSWGEVEEGWKKVGGGWVKFYGKWTTTTTTTPDPGALIAVNGCDDNLTWLVLDYAAIGIPTVGQYVAWNDDDTGEENGNILCGQVTATGQTGSHDGTLVMVGMGNCDDCEAYFASSTTSTTTTTPMP